MWHCFKIIVEKIWAEFFHSYWYFFCSYLFKNQTQIKKPKLDYILNFFFQLQFNFNFVKEEYESFLKNDNNFHFTTAANLYHILLKTIPKIKNFYLSLKMNNFFYFRFCLKELFFEFVTTNSPNYHKAILLQLLIFDYIEINIPNLFNFLKNEFSSLIEENNEAQLSLLSNEDSLTLANHSIIEEKYLLIPHYFKIQKYLKKNNDDFNNFFDKNEDVIKVFKKLLVLFKEEKFKHLLIKKNWKFFKPNYFINFLVIKLNT